VELQWRAHAARRADLGAAENGVAAIAGPATRAQTLTADPHVPAVRHADMSVAELAPGLVDRLSREVIRRIDRRAQIARERRGL
jgi:hypothetical protein